MGWKADYVHFLKSFQSLQRAREIAKAESPKDGAGGRRGLGGWAAVKGDVILSLVLDARTFLPLVRVLGPDATEAVGEVWGLGVTGLEQLCSGCTGCRAKARNSSLTTGKVS